MQVKPEPLIFPFAKFLYGPGPGGFADSFQFSTKAMQCEEGLLELFLRGKKKISSYLSAYTVIVRLAVDRWSRMSLLRCGFYK